MPRRSLPSTTLVASVRRYFGLDQVTLAAYLGSSRELLANIEAGRRNLTAGLSQRLLPLLQQLPDPAADPASAALAAPAAAPLAARFDYCQHHAAKLRRELKALETQLEYARRWQQALPALLAAPPERTRAWLLRRQEQAAADLDAEVSARYHLLRLRAAALEAEAAGLQQLLAPA